MTERYGGSGTIHQTGHLNVELGVMPNGEVGVVAVWFRCRPLAFTQHRVDDARAREMRQMYGGMDHETDHIVAIEFVGRGGGRERVEVDDLRGIAL